MTQDEIKAQEPVAYLVYAKGSHKYMTLTFDTDKVPEIYKGGDVVALCAAGAQPAPEVTKDSIRAAGGIVHSDGNVFFTSMDQIKAMLATALAQPTIRDFRTVQDHIKTVDIVGWRWVATCGSGSYQLTDYEPMRGYSYKSPVYEVPPVQAQERKPLTMIEMVDAAMVETADIYPPITRSQCERVISAAANGIKEQS